MEPILVNSAAGRPGLKKWKPVVSWLWKLAMLLFPMGTGTHCLYAFFSSKWLNPPPGGGLQSFLCHALFQDPSSVLAGSSSLCDLPFLHLELFSHT